MGKEIWFNTDSVRFRIIGSIAFFLVSTAIINILVANNELEKLSVHQSKKEARAMSDAVLSALNSMMVQERIGQRARFIELFKTTTLGLNEVRVFRSASVTAQFGPGFEGEQPIDDLDRQVLASGEPAYEIVSGPKERQLRAVMPFVMTRDRGGVNCLDCHQGKEGTVNGAVSMLISLAEVDRALAQNKTYLTVTNIIGMLVTLSTLIYLQWRFVLAPLRKLRTSIEEIERDSDLSRSIDIYTRNEVGVTAMAFNRMLGKFQSIISHMAGSADQLAAVTTELTYTTDQSSEQANVQSAKVAEMTEAIEEVNKAISSIAVNTVDVARISEVTRVNAMKGGKVIRGSSDAIESLSGYSSKIGNILLVIEDIAKKTDLLAINAAIEAANAGEQGKGFAVVADEVRKLAERTTRATAEINVMVKDIQTFTSQASNSMSDSNDAMNNIIHDATRVNEMVDQIAAATEKQSGIISAMLGAVRSVREYSDGFVMAAGQTKSVAVELSNQSMQLQGVVDQFVVSGETKPRTEVELDEELDTEKEADEEAGENEDEEMEERNDF